MMNTQNRRSLGQNVTSRPVVFVIGLIVLAFVALALWVAKRPLIPDLEVLALYGKNENAFKSLRDMVLEDATKHELRELVIAENESIEPLTLRTGSATRSQAYKRLLSAARTRNVDFDGVSIFFYLDGVTWSGHGRRKGVLWHPQPQQLRSGHGDRYLCITGQWFVAEIVSH